MQKLIQELTEKQTELQEKLEEIDHQLGVLDSLQEKCGFKVEEFTDEQMSFIKECGLHELLSFEDFEKRIEIVDIKCLKLRIEHERIDKKSDEINAKLEIFQQVGEVVAQAQRYLPVAKVAIDEMRDEFTDAIKLFIGLGIDIREALDDEVGRLAKMKAKDFFRYYKELQEAGFSKGEAFKILLAGIKSISFSELLSKDAITSLSRKSSK